MIHPGELSTPEQGLELLDRDDGKPRKRDVELRQLRQEVAGLQHELAGIRARLASARTLEPKKLHRIHNCRTCFRQARDATIEAIENP